MKNKSTKVTTASKSKKTKKPKKTLLNYKSSDATEKRLIEDLDKLQKSNNKDIISKKGMTILEKLITIWANHEKLKMLLDFIKSCIS